MILIENLQGSATMNKESRDIHNVFLIDSNLLANFNFSCKCTEKYGYRECSVKTRLIKGSKDVSDVYLMTSALLSLSLA